MEYPYLESYKVKKNPSLYNIGKSVSWILKENFVYNFLKNIDLNKKILDIGCANGYFLDQLKKQGYFNIFGVDIANYLDNKNHKHNIVDINVEKLPHKENLFDLVTAFQTIEHLENYFLILQEVTRVLKSKGYFILSVPNQFNLFYRVKFALTGNMKGWSLNNNHLLFLTKDVFKKTYLRDFDLVDTFYDRGLIPFIGRLTRILGLKVKSKIRIMPRCEIFATRVCYILRKK